MKKQTPPHKPRANPIEAQVAALTEKIIALEKWAQSLDRDESEDRHQLLTLQDRFAGIEEEITLIRTAMLTHTRAADPV